MKLNSPAFMTVFVRRNFILSMRTEGVNPAGIMVPTAGRYAEKSEFENTTKPSMKLSLYASENVESFVCIDTLT